MMGLLLDFFLECPTIAGAQPLDQGIVACVDMMGVYCLWRRLSFLRPPVATSSSFSKESGNMKFLFYFETGPYYVALTVFEFTTWS